MLPWRDFGRIDSNRRIIVPDTNRFFRENERFKNAPNQRWNGVDRSRIGRRRAGGGNLLRKRRSRNGFPIISLANGGRANRASYRIQNSRRTRNRREKCVSMRDNLFRELLTNLGKLDRSFLLFASGLTGSNGAHLGRLRSIRARVGQIQWRV